MNRPRIAFVTGLCPYYRQPLFERLAQQFEASFFFFSKGEERYLGPALRHEPGDLPVRELRRVAIGKNPLLVGLQTELRPENYDAVVKCIDGRLMLPYTYHLARQRGIPFVLWSGVWDHPQTLVHRVTRPWVEHIYRGSNAIVTYGDHVARFIEKVPGVAGKKIYVAGQAINPAPLASSMPDFEEPPRVLYIGRLEESKGVEDLLRAFSAVSNDDASLRIVGSGSRQGEIRAAAKFDSRIEVVGETPHASIPAELRRARCLVLPSVKTKWGREPWGLVINEAMTAGVPVITTDAVGAAAGGLVRDERNGFVVPERTPWALAAAISRLVSDASLARRLGAQGRADVAAFNYPRMARAFADAIDYAIRTRTAGTEGGKLSLPPA